MKITHRTLGLVCLLLVGIVWAAQAQVLVPIWTEAQPIALKDYRIDVQIVDLIAQVTITQVYFNPNERVLEGRYLFPLPSGASVSGLSLCAAGDCTEGTLLDASEARQIYQDIVRQTLDPALLQSVGERAFEVRVFPIPANGEKTVQLRYQQVMAAPRADMDDTGQSAVQYSQSLKAMNESSFVSRARITRLIDGEVFVREQNGLWKPLNFDEEPDLVVQFGSPAYFWLADQYQLKNVFSLGTDIIVPINGKQVLISQDEGITETATLTDLGPSTTQPSNEVDQTQDNGFLWWWIGAVMGVVSLVGIAVMLKK